MRDGVAIGICGQDTRRGEFPSIELKLALNHQRQGCTRFDVEACVVACGLEVTRHVQRDIITTSHGKFTLESEVIHL
ncbi:hypothetical protein CCR82_11430 [Halochromatium salexigens]|uniref:Uncharacterized protein n=1 Tax=Halochromatium salexigens TaxID=49447 RepID=A0AAJ0UIG1_HALSE|nr:hypothetical protein [Halochromatium salexigens]